MQGATGSEAMVAAARLGAVALHLFLHDRHGFVGLGGFQNASEYWGQGWVLHFPHDGSIGDVGHVPDGREQQLVADCHFGRLVLLFPLLARARCWVAVELLGNCRDGGFGEGRSVVRGHGGGSWGSVGALPRRDRRDLGGCSMAQDGCVATGPKHRADAGVVGLERIQSHDGGLDRLGQQGRVRNATVGGELGPTEHAVEAMERLAVVVHSEVAHALLPDPDWFIRHFLGGQGGMIGEDDAAREDNTWWERHENGDARDLGSVRDHVKNEVETVRS